MYAYTYVKGRKQLDLLLQRMGKDKPRFVSVFAHVDDITIELIYEMPNDKEGYRDYYILYMQHATRGTHSSESDIRHEVHQNIRNGEIGLRKV